MSFCGVVKTKCRGGVVDVSAAGGYSPSSIFNAKLQSFRLKNKLSAKIVRGRCGVIGIIAPSGVVGRCNFAEKISSIMEKTENLKNLRVSREAVARILWNAIDAGADGKTLRAICEYISDPAAGTPSTEVYAPAFDEAVAETDRAARRREVARAAAARRRERRGSPQPPVAAGSRPEPQTLRCASSTGVDGGRKSRDARGPRRGTIPLKC